MTTTVSPIRQGLHTVTPHLTISDSKKAIEFYKKAFNAEEKNISEMPDGKVIHAEIKIGDSYIFLHDEFPEMGALGPTARGGSSASMCISVTDVDKSFKQATDAGCTVMMPLANQFWGDRYGAVVDPFGHVWELCTHIEDVSPEEMQKRMLAMKDQMDNCAK
ncbi:MAG: VOC family protein [Candidatus Obscuribacterales bacterium]|nr:VOC family protein [Candidatus Obscuribacterales bacterium]